MTMMGEFQTFNDMMDIKGGGVMQGKAINMMISIHVQIDISMQLRGVMGFQMTAALLRNLNADKHDDFKYM